MRTQLSHILVENYNLNEDVLAEAQRTREEKGGSIGDILVQQKSISESQLLEALSNLYDLPYWPILPLENIESEFIEKLPIQFLKKYFMVPLEYENPITAANCGLSPNKGTGSDNQVSPPGHIIAINDPPVNCSITLVKEDRTCKGVVKIEYSKHDPESRSLTICRIYKWIAPPAFEPFQG